MLTNTNTQADFAYDLADDGAGLPARVAIFGAEEGLRRQIAADLGGAGFRTIDGGSLRALLEGPIALLGDVVVVDCAVSGSRGIDAMMLAGLARLDMRVARSGAKLIVATNLEGLDDVFAVLDQSNPQILVSPSRAERVIAVGRVMGEAGAARLREMGEEDRVTLLRLSQQVEAIAHSLDRLSHAPAPGATVLGEFKRDYAAPEPSVFGSFGAAPWAGRRSHRLPLPPQRSPIRRWCGRSSPTVRRARGSSIPNCSAIRRGTCCSISPPRMAKARGFRYRRCALPRASRQPPRCAG